MTEQIPIEELKDLAETAEKQKSLYGEEIKNLRYLVEKIYPIEDTEMRKEIFKDQLRYFTHLTNSPLYNSRPEGQKVLRKAVGLIERLI